MIEIDLFIVDLVGKKVIKDGVEVYFMLIEWGMLEMLVCNCGKLVGCGEFFKEVWGLVYVIEIYYLWVYLV